MFGKRNQRVPWDEVGIVNGEGLLSTVNTLSRPTKDGLGDLTEPGIPDFDGPRWKYELCIFVMFWMWYVANSPKLREAGATKPLLDAHHRGCLRSMTNAGLVGRSGSDIRKWEDDLEERFMAYKKAFETVEREPASIVRGTVGWVFSNFLFPGQNPNPKLALSMRVTGNHLFTNLVEMIESLRRQYGQL